MMQSLLHVCVSGYDIISRVCHCLLYCFLISVCCPCVRVDGQQLEQEPESDLDTYHEDIEQQPYEEGKWISPSAYSILEHEMMG